MEWPVSQIRDEEKQVAMIDLPLVRQLKVERTVATTPAETVTTSAWEAATPETVGGFTAVGYFFARELNRKLGVPVGIINSSWGGTAIEAWMSDASRAATTHGLTHRSAVAAGDDRVASRTGCALCGRDGSLAKSRGKRQVHRNQEPAGLARAAGDAGFASHAWRVVQRHDRSAATWRDARHRVVSRRGQRRPAR